MTVSTTLNKIIYPGNNATTVFSFSFPAVAAADLQVFFTDALGNITLLNPTAYTLSLNPAAANNPTAAGGTVTYNPLGVPIPTSTSLTIMRTLPITQGTSFANQGTLYQTAVEQQLDYVTMLVQQALEIQSRALVVAVSDATPNPLPAVASRANLVLGFDGSGNPIAVSTLPAGTVSSAMQPVINAATLAAGRTAFGLGAIATEGIGAGLQDDGASNVRTFYNQVADSTGQSVTSGFHTNVRVATGAITYTLPRANTLFNGFGFWVYALTGAITFAINGADAFSGAGSGASLVVPVGSRVFVSTDAQASGTWYVRGVDFTNFNQPRNYSLVTSVAAGALTIALKDANGNDPSSASPVLFAVSNGGTITPRAVTGPLSITVPSGASLGTVNGFAARIWVHLFDNAGSPILGVYNCLTNTSPNYSLLSWDETTLQSTTGISAGSTSAQTHYTASALTTKAFVCLGYLEATEATAGNWTTSPSKVQLFGPGVKRPGDTVQESTIITSTAGTTTSATFVPLTTGQSIALASVQGPNIVRVDTTGSTTAPGSSTTNVLQISRGNTANTNLLGSPMTQVNTAGWGSIVSSVVYDLPNGNTPSYFVQGKTTAGTLTYGGAASPVSMTGREIMV